MKELTKGLPKPYRFVSYAFKMSEMVSHVCL
ncbi:hypothetical protein NP493_107g04021 [Ridgeia piscesae]|uniref:Uncharacterized protein n=1 Tax=Ridgeia piscesae TaxID=27915 RepID=A0AAD9P778_RIDPI|nr:hypothetical protein NP493_107g04021 [Ridgeia piscesae]